MEEPAAHRTERLRITGRLEDTDALAIGIVSDLLSGERFRDLARRLVRREHERHAAPEDALEERSQDRIVGAPEDHRVHPGRLEGRRDLAHRLDRLVAEGIMSFDQRDEPRTRDGGHHDACIDPADELVVPPARHSRLGREQPDTPVPRCERSRVRLWSEDADDGDRKRALQVGERGRGCGVARNDDELDPTRLEKPAELEREPTDLIERARTVRETRVVAQIHDVLVRQRDEHLVEDGETAHPRVEHPDRPTVHPADSTVGEIGWISTPAPSSLSPMQRHRLFAAVAVTVAAAALAAAVSAAPVGQDVTITSADGTAIGATLVLPPGEAPTGGWPAVVILHGLGGDRSSSLALADSMALTSSIAVLAYDARGHGTSGGLIGIDGPNEVADAKAVVTWLAAQPEVHDTKIAGFGTSYGGGALFNSLVAGVPWAAIVANITWTDLEAALAPQSLAKTGVVAGFLSSLDPTKVDPPVFTVRDAAFAGKITEARPWIAARSSTPRLKGIRTPVLILQGRRDFAFGLEQALGMWKQLAGPKRIWFGLHGHAPSSFPAADSTAMLNEAALFLGTSLGTTTAKLDPATVAISPENWPGKPTRSTGLPKLASTTVAIPGAATIDAKGRWQGTTKATVAAMEVFGAPEVKVTATTTGGWSRLVAVLAARTPAGKEIVVAGGGVPTADGKKSYVIRLTSQATFLPKGTKLVLTIAASSLQQSPGNLLYLDLPMTTGAKASIGTVSLTIPTLATPVSR